MNYWAMGFVGERARVYVQATDPALIMSQLQAGEDLAPVTEEQKNHPGGIRLLGNMQVELIESGE